MVEKIKIIFLLIFLFLILESIQAFAQIYYLSQDSLKNNYRLWLPEQWKYQAGDDRQWAKPDFDDSDWQMQGTQLLRENMPEESWEGIGWFRLKLVIDSNLVDKHLAIGIWQSGASELYLDGELVHQFGTVGDSRETEQAYLERNPQIIIFSSTSSHLLAVRYSNHRSAYFYKYGVQAGFLVWVANWTTAQERREYYLEKYVTQKNIFMVIPVILALVHFLLFLHYSKFKQNLYYAFMLIGFAFLIYFQFQTNLTTSYDNILLFNKLFYISMMFSTLAGALTTYSHSPKVSGQFYIFAAGCITLTFLLFLIPNRTIVNLILILVIIILADILRVMIGTFSHDVYSRWIVRIGFIVLFISVTFQILTGFDILRPIPGIDYPYLIGILAMLFATSIDLARDFALTSRNLEQQLIQVRELSEKTIAQERVQREREIQQRLLEKENQRKSRELEEARQLQISMLPEPLHKFTGFDIYFHMQTATEVGGDYYDYHISPDKTLTIAIGDATGHGMKAGTMVSVIKSLFVAEGSDIEPGNFLLKCHKTIRQMRLGNLYMTLLLARLKDDSVSVVSAGMPPVLLYGRNDGEVTESIFKSLPLGAPSDFQVKPMDIGLHPGDILVLMSDGYLELFNPQQETLGDTKLKQILKENAGKSAREIVKIFLNAGEEWRGTRPQEDDITFIVVKKL